MLKPVGLGPLVEARRRLWFELERSAFPQDFLRMKRDLNVLNVLRRAE